VDADDEGWKRMTRDTRARVMTCFAGLRPEGAACAAEILGASIRGMRMRLWGPWGNIEASVPLIGTYNLMNVLQATSACFELGMDATQLARGLGKIKAPPGRLERVSTPEDAIAVFVDYAHTDDALRNMLTAVNQTVAGEKPRPNVWVVFGCGGDRDKTKRPKMGAAAAELADQIVVTSDNPRSEEPRQIVQEVLAGIGPEARGKLAVHVDREMAIRHAIEQAAPGDVVIIAGKGHETEQIFSDGKGGLTRMHFDDREVAREALNQRLRSAPVVRSVGSRGPAGRHAGE